MADGKKSFVLYCDQIHAFETLEDDEAGRLIKHIFKYVNDQDPIAPDRITEISFTLIKQQLKRDLRDWEASLTKRSDAGALGNLKRWHPDIYEKVVTGKLTIDKGVEMVKNNKLSHSDKVPSLPIPIVPIVAVNDNVNVNVNVNDTKSIKEVNTVVAEEEKINNNFYEFFRRAAGSHLSEKELKQEVGKFRNKYPNIHPNKCGALVNTWVANIGQQKPAEKKMVI